MNRIRPRKWKQPPAARRHVQRPAFGSSRQLFLCLVGAAAFYAALGFAQSSVIGDNPKSWGYFAFQIAGGMTIWSIVTGAVMSFLRAAHAELSKSRIAEFVHCLAMALLVGVLGGTVLFVLYNPAAFGPAGAQLRVSAVGTLMMWVGLVLQALLTYAGAYGSGEKMGPFAASRASARFFVSWRGFRLALGVLLSILAFSGLLRVLIGGMVGKTAFAAIIDAGLGLAAVYVSNAVWTVIEEQRVIGPIG